MYVRVHAVRNSSDSAPHTQRCGCALLIYTVSHSRGGIGGGHYHALCLNADDANWYSYNDSAVSRAALADLDPAEPYILFYHLRDQ